MEGLEDVVTMADDSARQGEFHGDADRGTGNIQGASRRDAGKDIRSGGDRDRHRVEMSLLPSKKRALNHSSGGPYINSDDSYSPSPKKRRFDDCIVGAERKDAEGGEAHPCSVPAAAEGDAMSDAEKLRLSKGKWKAMAGTGSVAPQPPPVEKLMHEGIRSGARTNERFLLHQPPVKKKRLPRDVALDAEPVLGGAVRTWLAQLGATRPWFVHRKRLEKSDVCTNQNRLLVSCKRESLAGCPITRCFSPAEMRRVENKHVGLFVAALDRDGEKWHTLTCKFLDSNSGYRFISGWGDFLKWNGLVLDGRGRWTRDVDIELWAFRSRELRRQPVLGPDGKPVVGLEVDDHFHPDGSLGLLLLHRENRRRRVDHEEDDEGEERPLPVARRRETKKQVIKQRDHKRDTSASAARAEAALAGTDRELQGEATITKVEMVTKFGVSVSDAVIGMMGLRHAVLRERRENLDVGCAT